MRLDADFRFWRKVKKGSRDQCWEWLGVKTRKGYGHFRGPDKKIVYAHRYAYARLRGPVPKNQTIDHLCFNTSCVNPWHMEIVSLAVNNARARRRKLVEGN